MSLLNLNNAFFAGLDSARSSPVGQADPVQGVPWMSREEQLTYLYTQKIVWRLITYRKRNFDRLWRRLKRMFIGDQFPSADSPGWRSKIVANFLYKCIEEAAAMMTENEPKFILRPPSNDQTKYVDTMQAVLQSIWRKQKMKRKSPDFAKSMLLFGNAYFKPFWNPSLEEGLGDVQIDRTNSFHLWKDQYHEWMDTSNYVLYREPISTEDAVEQFPEIADRLNYAINYYRQRKEDTRNLGYNGLEGPAFQSPTLYNINTMDVPWVGPLADIGDDGESIVKTELWVRDPSTIEKMGIYIPKYNKGIRLIQMLGPLVVYGDGTPYEFSGFPYVEAKDISVPDEPYGFGTAAILQTMQNQINKDNCNITDWGTYFSNPLWIMDDMAMEDTTQLSTIPGLLVKKRKGFDVHREAPPTMPPSFFQAVDHAIRDLKDISGTSISTAHRAQARSAMAMEAVHEIASYIMKAKIRQLEQAHQDAGYIVIKLIQQYYTEDRIVRIIRDAEKTEFVEFNGRSIRGDWDLEVEPYSTLPVSRSVMNAQAAQNYQMGAIDLENYLSTINWPDRVGILKRKAESAKSQQEYEIRYAQETGKKPRRGGKMKSTRPVQMG